MSNTHIECSTCVYIYICIPTLKYVYTSTYTKLYVYIYMCIYIYICMCMYTCTFQITCVGTCRAGTESRNAQSVAAEPKQLGRPLPAQIRIAHLMSPKTTYGTKILKNPTFLKSPLPWALAPEFGILLPVCGVV